MRNLLLIMLMLLVLGPANSLNEKNYPYLGVVSDYAHVLTPSAQDKIERQAETLKRITSVNLCVATFYSINTNEVTSYGEELYSRWDVGQSDKKLDHGILIIITWAEQNVRIFVGEGVAPVLNEKVRESMEFSIIGELSRGNFSDAAVFGATAVTQLILSGPLPESPRSEMLAWLFPLSVLFLFTFLAPLAFSGDHTMTYSIALGGIFGYVFFGFLGMIVLAGISFLLNLLRLRG
ncbi:MAG: TPM domain-containing protein [Candidatus Margulisbacteria bacterium]|nr:TPM domain-containing protein [Candidatus Margulisiibacteriota bacterium]MBU1616666.1 TPM domain-containing protein [Candidatus Margulisiibacteriota bacterium]